MKGRWGWRQIATLCVSVWIMAACESALPTLPVSPLPSPEATLILRTALPSSATPQRATLPASASVAVTQTPLSRTPDIASSPHYYTVAPGDTLESVAAQFGMSVSALQEANGGLPPDMLIPGQALLIPASMSASAVMSGSPGSAPTDTPTGTLARLLPIGTPLPVLLPPPDCYHTPADELVCLGWVPNPLLAPLRDVAVRVVLRDVEGASRVESSTPLLQALIPPGEGAPYAVRFRAPPPFDVAEAALLSAGQGDAAAEMPVRLAWRDDRSRVEENVVRVLGAVRNGGDDAVSDLLIVIALLDAEGRMTGFRALRPAGTLAPGETLPIDTPLMPLGPGTVAHQVYAEGWPGPSAE